ncbi:hypothetical protein P7K49_027951 [Saguinus oedipus]|uniref:Uncharacterized protein n=1 Tax=Saguinus oedipus TaxID=9490 RepID=A0ABQ9UAV1_SAGOE|nr:hypothetical protein P7K49_027951 [Saguinus oedipus]
MEIGSASADKQWCSLLLQRWQDSAEVPQPPDLSEIGRSAQGQVVSDAAQTHSLFDII